MLQTRFVVRVFIKKFLKRYTGFFFALFHGVNICQNHPLCQGDNSVKISSNCHCVFSSGFSRS
jgi:hypothetical protein